MGCVCCKSFISRASLQIKHSNTMSFVARAIIFFCLLASVASAEKFAGRVSKDEATYMHMEVRTL